MESFTLLKGTDVAKLRGETLKEDVVKLSSQLCLAIIQVGAVPASTKYIEYKKKFGERVGARVIHIQLDEAITENEVCEKITELNNDTSIHGIIVQLPLPSHMRSWIVLDAIDPKKDVDGLTSYNLRHLYENDETIVPATTKGILTLLEHYNISCEGKHVVVVGRSSLVGKPTALAFLNHNATITICHSHTENLQSLTSTADILIVAVGSPHLIKQEYVKEGAVVIDVGINVTENNKVVGDTLLDSLADKARAASPVPGGIGPMTIVSLFENLLQAYKLQNN